MSASLISRREAAVWTGCFLLVASLLVVTRFTSTDADSMLYAGFSARLTHEPMERWIAPEWWGLWPRIGLTGFYRDHPIGGFVLPPLVARLGIPGEQAAYIVGVGSGLVALLLIARIVLSLTSRQDARAVLVLLQIMPVAFVFRIRANQEYAMLICLIVTILGLDRVRRSWWGLVLVASGLSAALVIKGAFVFLTVLGAGTWALIDPTRVRGSIIRPVVAGFVSLGVLLAVAVAYEVWYGKITGESFWLAYWERQFSQVEISTPLRGGVTFLNHVGFYLVRLLWHPAPWSLALVAAAWHRRGELLTWFRATPEPARRGLLFAVASAAVLVVALSPASRVAERYVFSGTYAVAAAGAVVAYRSWTRLRDLIDGLDQRVAFLPALVWLALMIGRLGLGPIMPRF